LVNNAAIDHTGDVLETPESEVRTVMETNYLGALWMLQHAGRAMRTRGAGSIVNVTSRLASIGIPTMSIYAASKGALLALTRGAAIELAPEGIRVNAVAPGFAETPLYREWLEGQDDPEVARERAEATIPQRRLARPEEVAATVAFVASDEAAHITGASIAIDGGYTAA
jgi:NAD(P)-dependent dehydrogenase (short-subunit alcohol dehydrogenase family)